METKKIDDNNFTSCFQDNLTADMDTSYEAFKKMNSEKQMNYNVSFKKNYKL